MSDENAPEPSEPRRPRSCPLPAPGRKRRLPCIPCYLYSVLLFLFVVLLLWLALRGGR